MKKKQISLIVPKNHQAETPHLFIGVVYLASYLEKKGFKVKIYDEQFGEASKKIKEILDNSFLAGFTVMTSQLKSAKKLSLQISKKGIPVVWGGTHPTLFPCQCLNEKYIRIFGEANAWKAT